MDSFKLHCPVCQKAIAISEDPNSTYTCECGATLKVNYKPNGKMFLVVIENGEEVQAE